MVNDGEVRIGTSIDTKGFEQDAKELKKEAEDLDRDLSKDLDDVDKKMNNMSKGLKKTSKSLTLELVGMGIALGGLALGVYLLSKAFENAFGSSEQLKANLSYIGFVASKMIENLLKPAIDKTTGAVEGLVNALYRALVYIGYIISAWTGKNLFEGTSVEDYAKYMEDANKSAKGTAKATKQIRKDLMGFDEANRLNDNNANGGSGNKVVLPTLPNLDEVPIPGWVKWLADNKDIIFRIIEALGGLFLLSKGVSFIKDIKDMFSFLSGGSVASGILGTLSSVVAICGSLVAIGWEINKIAKDREKLLKNVSDINEQGLKYNKEFVETTNDINALNSDLNYRREQANRILSKTRDITSIIFRLNGGNWETLINVGKQEDNILKKEIDMLHNGELSEQQKQDLLEDLKEQVSYNLEIFEYLEKQGKSTKYIEETNGLYKDVLKELGFEYSNIWETMGLVKEDTQQTYERTKNWQNTLGSVLGQIGQIDSLQLKKKDLEVDVEVKTENASKSLSNFFQNIGNAFARIFNASGLTEFASKIKSALPKIKLAQGGIINNPGRGVALGTNIIGGEAGAEAVLPLDDKTMDRLGSAIARHMTINATMINQMNGRTISRELQTIRNETDFTYNG